VPAFTETPAGPIFPGVQRRRLLTIAAALAGAALLAIAVQAGRWWQVGDVSIGPVSSHRCFSGECRVVGLGWLGGGTGWARLGQATYAAALLAALLLVVVAGALAGRRVVRIAAKSGLVAAGTALISGALFVAMFPDVEGASLGYGVALYAGGLVLAIVAHVMLLRTPVPPKP
jgi:hypothetical protein